MGLIRLIDTGIPGSGCGDVRFESDGYTTALWYEYRLRGIDYIAGMRFAGTIAFRFRDEPRSAGYAKGSYDCLVEITDSTWVSQMQLIEPSQLPMSVTSKRHFALMLSSNGFFEIVADNVEPIAPIEGRIGDAG
jgi:hypothetical protein